MLIDLVRSTLVLGKTFGYQKSTIKKSINIEYTPKRPIGLMEVQEMMDSPDWPTGMNITIQ